MYLAHYLLFTVSKIHVYAANSTEHHTQTTSTISILFDRLCVIRGNSCTLVYRKYIYKCSDRKHNNENKSQEPECRVQMIEKSSMTVFNIWMLDGWINGFVSWLIGSNTVFIISFFDWEDFFPIDFVSNENGKKYWEKSEWDRHQCKRILLFYKQQ